jgi:hypothetical protein
MERFRFATLKPFLPICTLSFGIIQDAQFEALRWQCGRGELIEVQCNGVWEFEPVFHLLEWGEHVG